MAREWLAHHAGNAAATATRSAEGTLTVKAQMRAEALARQRYAALLRKNAVLRRAHRKRMQNLRACHGTGLLRNPPVLGALIMALFKDTLDLALITSIFIVGNILSFLFGFIITMLIMVAGMGSQHRRARGVLVRTGIVALSSFVETFAFGLNIIPMQTIGVLLAYYFLKRERKSACRAARKKEQRRFAKQRMALMRSFRYALRRSGG